MGHRLLVVDSDRRFLQEHQTPLEAAFDVDFRDGTEGALAQLESGAYAAALICVEASENKGYSLCSAIRRSPSLGDFKVALISAKATEEEYARHQTLKGKADLYLHKPIRPSNLVSALTPMVPLKSMDPDNPLGDLGGGDLGDEWLESLRSELEADSPPPPPPVPPSSEPPAAPSPVATMLGLAHPFAPLPAQTVTRPLPVPKDAGRIELLEARVKDLEQKLVARAEQLEETVRELDEVRRESQAAQGLVEAKDLQVLELETRVAAADEALAHSRRELADGREQLEQCARDLDDSRQQEAAARAEVQAKTQLNMDLMESNQLLQAQLAEAREDQERLARSERALLARNQEIELERNELLEAREQISTDLASLGRLQSAEDESHERQKMELLSAIDERDARLGRLEGVLAAHKEQILALEQARDTASRQLQQRSERLQAVTGKLGELESHFAQIMELSRSETEHP